MAAPILVTGSNRSGTTWLGKLLAAPSDVVYINELFNLDHPQPGLCSARFPHWFTYLTEENGRPYVAALDRTLRFDYDWGDALRTAASPRNGLRAARAFPKTRVAPGSRALVKDPIAVFSAGWLARTFDMQVVLTVRHPAGFAASLKRLDWRFDFGELLAQPLLMRDMLAPYRDEIERFAASPPDIIDQAGLLWTLIYGTVGDSSWITVRQEDLARDPQTRLRELYEHLGLAWSDEVAVMIERATGAENPAEAPQGKAHTAGRDSRAAAGAWRERLTAEEIDRVRRATAPAAGRYYSDADW